jgi:hypothetical protein
MGRGDGTSSDRCDWRTGGVTLFTLLIAMAFQATEFQPVLRVRIGALDQPEPEAFGRIQDLAVGPDGRIYVLDQQAAEVRVFDPDGGFLFRFGRRGEGPAEFRTPVSIEVSAEEVFVQNASGRASRFTIQGEHIASVNLGRSTGWGIPLGQDRYAVHKPGTATVSTIKGTETLLLVGPEAADTLASIPSAALFITYPRGRMALKTPFCDMVHFARLPDGSVAMARGDSGTVSVGKLEPEGWSWSEVFRAAPAPAPLTNADYEEILRRVPERYRAEVGREDISTAPTRSSICGLEIDRRGGIWVRMPNQRERELWVLHDPDPFGPMGQLLVPAGVEIRAFGIDTAVGIWKDELGVEYVMVYDLDQGSPSSG